MDMSFCMRTCEVKPVYIEDSQGVVQQREPGWTPNDFDDEFLLCVIHPIFVLQQSDSDFMEMDLCGILNKATNLTLFWGWDLWKTENQRCPLRHRKVNMVSSDELADSSTVYKNSEHGHTLTALLLCCWWLTAVWCSARAKFNLTFCGRFCGPTLHLCLRGKIPPERNLC